MIKIAIIGAGFGTIGLRPAFESVKGCKVVAVAATRSEWRKVLETKGLDAIAIATPPRAQYQIAKAAMNKGLHVFAEKPLAANAKQAKELLALARKKKVVHGVDLMFPDIPEWAAAKKLLDSKKYGALREVNVEWDWMSNDIKLKRWSWRTKRSEGGGALSFYFSHGLYYLEQFAGPIKSGTIAYSYAKGNPNNGEAGFELALQFKSGATGTVHVSSNNPGVVRHSVELISEKGSLILKNKNAVVDNFRLEAYTQKGAKHIFVRKEKNKRGVDERVKVVKKLATRFVTACARGTAMTPSFVDGVRVEELIETLRKHTI